MFEVDEDVVRDVDLHDVDERAKKSGRHGGQVIVTQVEAFH
jgi:hypothetical protein